MTRAREVQMGGAIALAAAAILLLPGLGTLDLWAPDEPRYAEIADEIVRSDRASSWILLELGGEPYTQKPPLYYWLAALPGLVDGRVSEWDARWPSALAGIAAVFLTFRLGLSWFGSQGAALYSALILLGSFRFLHLARRAQLDVLLTAFELVAWLAFARAECGQGSRRTNTALLHAALGAAVLTKGPVALLPLLAIALYLVVSRRSREIRQWVPAWGLCLSLGPALLWLAAAWSLAPPDFLEAAVVENLFGRFFAGTSHDRPLYYYFVQFPIDFMPATLLWPLLALEAWRRRGRAPDRETNGWRAAGLWLGIFFVFFSLSAGKRGLYLLPAFPAAALLCGAALDAALRRRTRLPTALRSALGIGLLATATAAAALALGPGVVVAPGFALPQALGAALFAIALAAAGGAWLLRKSPRAALCHVAIAIGFVLAVEASVLGLAYPAFDAQKSPRAIAAAANRWAVPDSRIGLFHERALLGGLLYYGRFYGDRPIETLSDPREVSEFLRAGHVVVVSERDRSSLGALPIRETLRRGRRAIHVARIAHGDDATRREPRRTTRNLSGESVFR